MKLSKRTGAVLGFLIALAGGVVAATSWEGLTYSPDALNKAWAGITVGYDGGSGAAVPVTSSTPLPVTATVASGSNVDMGAKADSSATTDTGTFSLIALTKRIATHLTRVWQGPTASCATIRAGVTAVNGSTAATSVDAGATGTGYWTAVKNMSRTFDIEVGGISSGTFRIGPLDSVTLSKPAAATPDSVTVGTNCSGCPSTATNVSIIACDDD